MYNLILFSFHPLRMRTPLKHNVIIIFLVPFLTIQSCRAANILTLSSVFSSHSPSFTCNFTRDCDNYTELRNIQSVDVAFSCNFGRCVQSSPVQAEQVDHPARECESYQDCDCRYKMQNWKLKCFIWLLLLYEVYKKRTVSVVKVVVPTSDGNVTKLKTAVHWTNVNMVYVPV